MIRALIRKIKRRETRFYSALNTLAQSLMKARIPSGPPLRQVFQFAYQAHIITRETAQGLLKFFYYEPLFRARCSSVGNMLRIERLPYIVGNGDIVVGDNCFLCGRVDFVFNDRVFDDAVISIGDHTFVGHNTSFNAAREIRVGSHCLIAGDVRIADFDGHPLNPEERRFNATVQASDVRPVCIEDDVWIGHGVIVLKGVTIGAGSVVGAGALVHRDIPPRSIAVGNPARVVGSVDQPRPVPEIQEQLEPR